jgi:hypothetical protein
MDTSGDEDYSKVGAGFKRLPPGRFHCEIIEVDESFQKHAQKDVKEVPRGKKSDRPSGEGGGSSGGSDAWSNV